MSKSYSKLSVKKFLVAGSLFALTGCGGSTDDNSNSEELKPRIFATTVVYRNGAAETALTLYSSRAKYVAVFGPDEFSFGSLTTKSGKIQDPGTDYNLFNNWEKTEGSASGSVETEEHAIFHKKGGFAPSTVTAQRINELSDSALSFEYVFSTYTARVSFNTVVSITINSSGALTGSDSTVCIYNGNVSIPDDSASIYEAAYTASHCGGNERASGASLNGSFEGIEKFIAYPDLGKVTFSAVNNGEIVELFDDGFFAANAYA